MQEKKNNKCSSKKHGEIDAIYFCEECRVYMCNKCENFHSDLCHEHHSYNLRENKNEIFTGLCKEEDHLDKLQYFCKTHNQLCCVKCISKIKGKGNGQHTDCNLCFIEDIKQEKKNKLQENIKYLQDISGGLDQSINELKKISEKINESQENLKAKIQKIFTLIRNALNQREDELLLEVEKLYNDLYFNQNMLKENEKLPNKVKISLEKAKVLENDWNDDIKLSFLINDCINIENNIKNIIKINENLKKYNSIKVEIHFEHDENKVNKFLKIIKTFGDIHYYKEGILIKLNKKININEGNNILLISNQKVPLLNNLLKFNNSINKIEIQSPEIILPKLIYQNIKNLKLLSMICKMEDLEILKILMKLKII